MILATTKIAKIIILLFVLCVAIRLSYKRMGREKLVRLGICTVIIAVGANVVAGFAPQLTEEVTLTALGEKNSLAQSDEVVLLGMKVDGKEIEIGKPKKGKWFWGTHYMWRNEADSRQPKGTTRNVTLEVPVGWEREIEFATDQWNGYVQVECLGQTQICDTYSAEKGTSSAVLPDSIKRNLVLQCTLEIGIYGLILLGWLGVYVFLTKKEYFYYRKVKQFVKNYPAYFCCGIVVGLIFLQMSLYAEKNTFWNDELWQIQFCLANENPLKTLLITHNNYYPDLISPVLSLWYRIAPYGEKWLLLPQELAVAIGVYLVGITTNHLQGLRTAFLATIIGGSFSNMVFQCAYEFRGYGFLFLMCSIAFCVYTRCRQQETECTWKNAVLLGVSLWLPMTSHVFGVFFSAGLILTDCFFMLQRKLTFKWFWSYVIAGILYLPWLYNMLCYNVMDMHAEWQGQPTFRGVIRVLKYLTNQSSVCFLLLLIGLCFTLGALIYRKLYNDEIAPALIAPVVVLFFVIGFVFIYGRWINPKAAMWMDRYFIVLFPVTIYLCSVGGDTLCDAITKKRTVLAICGAISINLLISNMNTFSQPAPTSYQHFKEAADWFYTQQNMIYNEDTLIICAPEPLEGWQEYYITKQGLRDPLTVVSQYSLSEQDLENKNLVYVYYEHIGVFDSTKKLLKQEGLMEVADDSNLKIQTFVRQ